MGEGKLTKQRTLRQVDFRGSSCISVSDVTWGSDVMI